MAVMRMLERPETVETKHGFRKATHEVYCYSINPFISPPITVSIYKGTMDATGPFQVMVESQTTIDVGQ